MSASEFDLIARIRARLGEGGEGVRLGIGDDAALLAVPAGMQLAVTADTLNAGVHFPDATAPADIGWKALAVNLSDLAAMGALPAWCTLALSAPALDAAWLDGFLDGFCVLAGEHGVALVGGDTTRGPLSISITAMGWLPPDAALRRDGARVDDDVWVTGTLGDAAVFSFERSKIITCIHGGMAVVHDPYAADQLARLAERAPLDKQNRIKLNPFMMKECSIDRDVVIMGSIQYMQIFDQKVWREYYRRGLPQLGAAASRVAKRDEPKPSVQYVINAGEAPAGVASAR